MKKMMIALFGMLTIAASGKAMSYEQARNEALFLTDKMAYELNLTDEQYEAAYEINLDYLMGVTSYDDVYGDYWERRNRDLSYILLDAQWQAYIAASYFYRPLYWHLHGTHGYYYHHRHHFRPARHTHFGMLDRWNRGDFHHHHGGKPSHHGGNLGHHGGTTGHHGGTSTNNGNGHHRPDNSGGPRTSSTRTTVNHSSGSFGSSRSSGSFGSSRSSNGGSFGSSRSNGSFGSSRSSSSSSSSASRGGFGGGSRSSSSHSGGSRSSGSFGSRR